MTVGLVAHNFGTGVKMLYCTHMDNKANAMSTPIFSLSPEMQESWDYVMGQMLSFVNDTHADCDSAYDFVCEQLEIDGFVENEKAWDDFYMTWESADNRCATHYNYL